MIIEKSIEYWAAIMGTGLYILTRDAGPTSLIQRLIRTVASAFLSVALSPAISAYFGVSETLTAVFIMAFGILILDGITAVINDKTFIKDILKIWMQGKMK